jgi:hypothetical protein
MLRSKVPAELVTFLSDGSRDHEPWPILTGCLRVHNPGSYALSGGVPLPDLCDSRMKPIPWLCLTHFIALYVHMPIICAVNIPSNHHTDDELFSAKQKSIESTLHLRAQSPSAEHGGHAQHMAHCIEYPKQSTMCCGGTTLGTVVERRASCSRHYGLENSALM